MALILTNKHNLPDVIVNAVKNDGYTRGKSDISVTQLITPPYQRKLMQEIDQIEDVSSRTRALLGTAVHHIIERGAPEGSLMEQRLFAHVLGWTVSGQFDLIALKKLLDFKVTSVYSHGSPKIEWEQQLNLLRLLALLHADSTNDDRFRIEQLSIIAIYRDFLQSKAGSGDYPEVEIVEIPINVWDKQTAVNFLNDRVKAHQDPSPPPCTDEERWATPETFALMKKDRKSAIKLYEIREEADAACAELNAGDPENAEPKKRKKASKDHYVENRPKSYRRCESYCSVAHGCPHHNSNPAGPF
jgi:hypothetical protein